MWIFIHQHQSIYCWGLKWTQKAVTSKIISTYRNLALIYQLYLLTGGPWPLLTPGEALNSFPLLVKKLFNLPTAISPDIWRKRGLFPSEFGLRRGCTGKAELFLCSLWVKSMDIWKSRLKYHKKKLTVYQEIPRRALPWWIDCHPSFRLCLVGFHIYLPHSLSTRQSTQADGIFKWWTPSLNINVIIENKKV